MEGIPFKKAAEVKEDLSYLYQDETEFIQSVCKIDRKLELLAACFGKAEKRLSSLINSFDKEKTGVIMGVGADVTPFELFEEKMYSYMDQNTNSIIELFTELNNTDYKLNYVNNPYDIYAIYLAQKFNAAAFQKSILTACVSSTQALALAFDEIVSGETEIVIAGGTDSLVNKLAMISFGKLGVIAESNEDFSCKPFDTTRSGTLAGEAAGFVILASEDFVKRHHIKPVAQLLGYGNTMDAYKITAPDPEGKSMVQAMQNLMKSCSLTVDKIDYINAHGTGTVQNDLLELKSFEKALGNAVKQIPISSTKDRHGHAIAAAGIQEVCVLLELMKANCIPGNLHLNKPCVSDFSLPKENMSSKIQYALTSNFAFGGINTILAIKNEMI
jgi:3-oxoacyl-[acyl-carrier-protein] synthase II